MANTEQFVVMKIGEDLYENIHCGIVGNGKVMKEYAAQKNYGGGVVVYVKLPHGYEFVPIDQVALTKEASND